MLNKVFVNERKNERKLQIVSCCDECWIVVSEWRNQRGFSEVAINIDDGISRKGIIFLHLLCKSNIY